MRALTRHPDSARAGRALSAVLGFTVRELSAPWRHRPIVVARSAACLGLRLVGWSYPQIGTLLWRDHSTVMGACSAAECEAWKRDSKAKYEAAHPGEPPC